MIEPNKKSKTKRSDKIKKCKLKKKMPQELWPESVLAIQFDGTFECIKLISKELHVSAKMDRKHQHQARCRIIVGKYAYDILVRKGQWVVWNGDILRKNDLQIHTIIWDDALFCKAYRFKK